MTHDMVTEETARAVAQACGRSRFEYCSYNAKSMAQRNLSGRTHYADDDTLRFFHARIYSARVECRGLVLVLLESVAADVDDRWTRGHRFAAFDLFGTCIARADMESLHKTGDKARQAAAEWLESFDVAAHYRQAMTERADSLVRKAEKLRAGAMALDSVPA